MFILGIDPGPVVGVARLHLWPTGQLAGLGAMQVTPGLLVEVLDGLHAFTAFEAVAVEQFVVSSRAGRSATAVAGQAARDVTGLVADWAAQKGVRVHLRSAAEVKPWATDNRLEATGLIALTQGMRHARDAARHALYAAVRSYGLPDPLSRKGTQ